ncbi:MAG TPA: lytic transglycosylase domain-containing protein [Thermoanaerobaculia bacterium]|nr:lytic transglycosylase domain-containing protein [Thermoanaerobaculia bacterium]
MQALRRKWGLVAAGVPVVVALVFVGAWYAWQVAGRRPAAEQPSEPAAPPDLEKLRTAFRAGVDALHRNDAAEAVRQLSSFDFGSRAVEEYRLYYLASGYQGVGNVNAARQTLARLWARSPRLVHATDVGFSLANLQLQRGALRPAAGIYQTIAVRTDAPAVAGTARWQELETRFTTGEIAAVFDAARLITIRSPRAPQVSDAIEIMRSLTATPAPEPLALTHADRLERAVSLMRDGDPKEALIELDALALDAPQSLRHPIDLNRGLALHHMRRFEDSNKVLDSLGGSSYRYAIPALYHSAKNYRTLSAAIDPSVTKTVKEKRKVGTMKVRVGKGKKARTVTRPRYRTVTKTVKLVDLAKKEKKERYASLYSERLRDLLQLPLADPVRLEVLNAIIALAQEKNQDEYLQELVPQVIALDAGADPALQHFWNKAWAAYSRGDFGEARPLFRFIADTYASVNIRRQCDYWFARTIERQGETEQAAAIYQRLASAPYADLYAQHAVARGATRTELRSNPLTQERPDWRDIAEKEMPKELRLAYELTALSAYRDARLEVQKNLSRENQRFGDAILADLYHSTGNALLMYTAIRRAFPQLATVEQDSAPAHFLRMYYPIRYEDLIHENARRNNLDPHLVMGLILQESYYNPEARSRVGATGLMQIMPATGKELAHRLRVPFGERRLENPEVNIRLGTFYLRHLINTFGGNVYMAVAAYNGGQGNVSRWRRASPGKPNDEFLESIPFPETRNYVKRVTLLRSSYARIAG